MRLINELNDNGFKIRAETPRVHCKAFEDNSGALEMARTPKMWPRIKHINIKYHHFSEAVLKGEISIWSSSQVVLGCGIKRQIGMTKVD
jgi:hypothetical protein